jgi:hypothetical protein
MARWFTGRARPSAREERAVVPNPPETMDGEVLVKAP